MGDAVQTEQHHAKNRVTLVDSLPYARLRYGDLKLLSSTLL
jgi:hypothetical protein